MDMLAKIRRMHYRDGMSIREVAKRTGLARNTVRSWLRSPDEVEPKYPTRRLGTPAKLGQWAQYLEGALLADSHRPARERRTGRDLYEQIRALGYVGSYSRVTDWIRAWHDVQLNSPRRAAFVPLSFELGEAFQFDWSCEYAFVGGLRRRLEVAHLKLAASRAFWLVAYFHQSHEMLFDAHARSFAALGGVPKRGIYDNMRTAVDKIGPGKQRNVNLRFQAMCSHYLFEPEFCNRASGWEKGIVEKNVQDRRRHVWREAMERRWACLEELNAWLAETCRQSWQEISHPEWHQMKVADVLQDEQTRLMPCPRPFDGYVEQPVRVSHTALIHFQKNRYSVPTQYVNQALSLRIYPSRLVVVADGAVVAEHARSFDIDETVYDWQHYISLVAMKPGALRNGAPFKTMPDALITLQRHLQRHQGGDRVMAQVLGAVPIHGLEAVLVSVELALESGRPSAEHVLNVLARLKEGSRPAEAITTALRLQVEPQANLQRYDSLRNNEA